jgi:ppGpp synthetase/RelA/SpoT-type nucleotidyltranferase
MNMNNIEALIEYRRSQESPEERAARIKLMNERMAETDKRLNALFLASIPSETLLNKVISL